MFTLDKKLALDSYHVKDLELSRLLLMNDSNYPWFILVPRKNNLVELTDLDFNDQIKLLKEINIISKILKENFNVDKINIATLGNIVKQLHIHIIGRKLDDASFPKPVWGNSIIKKYNQDYANRIITKLNKILTNE